MNDPFKNMREQEERRREKRRADELREQNERARKDSKDFTARSNKHARDMLRQQMEKQQKQQDHKLADRSKMQFGPNRFANPNPTDPPLLKNRLDVNKPPVLKSKLPPYSKPTYQPSTASGGESNLLATLIGFGIFLCFAAVVVALMIS